MSFIREITLNGRTVEFACQKERAQSHGEQATGRETAHMDHLKRT
jgi:hypothetical protein